MQIMVYNGEGERRVRCHLVKNFLAKIVLCCYTIFKSIYSIGISTAEAVFSGNIPVLFRLKSVLFNSN